MKLLVGKVRTEMAGATTGSAEKQYSALFLGRAQGRVISLEVSVKW
jgi:hypothetical protein